MCPLYLPPQSVATAAARKSSTTKLRTAVMLRLDGFVRRSDKAEPGMFVAEQPNKEMLPSAVRLLIAKALPHPPEQLAATL